MGGTGPGVQHFGVKEQRLAWPIDSLATRAKPGREREWGAGSRASSGMRAPAGGCGGWAARAGVGTFLGARPRGQRGAEQQQQPEPQGPAPLHGAGRDLGPRPRQLGQVAGVGKPGRPGGGGGVGPDPGAESWPHLVHLLKETVGQEGNLLDR
jgi:hypothetical protein